MGVHMQFVKVSLGLSGLGVTVYKLYAVSNCIEVCRRMLGRVYDNEKENRGILTNKEIYAVIKKPTITETVRLHRLCWFGHVQRMEENGIFKRVLYKNLDTTRPRGKPRNRWQGRIEE
jgi:hypothetical protein